MAEQLSSSISRIALLGLGTMGSGMARNLLRAGFEVRGWNRDSEKALALVPQGLIASIPPTEACREADAIVVCLADDAALREILFRAHVLESLRPGQLLLDCGTTSLALTEEIAKACRERDCEFLDAPISGSKLGAEAGKLTIMVGGKTVAFQRAQPIFSAIAAHVLHVGEDNGLGQKTKLCQNMIQAIMLQGTLEGFTLAKKLGVPLAALADILEHSAGRSGVGSFKTPYLFAGDFRPHFRLDLMAKDLHMALGCADAMKLPLPLGTGVKLVYDQAIAEGLGALDFLATVKLLERWAQSELRVPSDSEAVR